MSISTTYTYLPQSFAGEIRQVSFSNCFMRVVVGVVLLQLLSVPDFSSQPQSSSAARFLHLTHHKRIADAYNIRNK